MAAERQEQFSTGSRPLSQSRGWRLQPGLKFYHQRPREVISDEFMRDER
jgi:hypothetical protein